MQTLIVGATFGFPKAEPLICLFQVGKFYLHLKPFEPMIWTFVSTLLEYKGMMPFPLFCLDGIGSSSLQKFLF
jgi:hypothetical protein